ncbi:MAG: cell envelope integrity protein TolA [Gammaproteobacteria bacterium]|nr:cell envelope integrity protein TolA [Gammaproteobacteria bacterium]
MVRILLAGFLLLCHCGPTLASWELVSEGDSGSDGILKSVGIQDNRGNKLIIYRDANGAYQAGLYLNAYLPEPDQPGTATPVLFTVDDNAPHSIDTGTWVAGEPHRKLAFQLGDPVEAGLSEALIEIIEGTRISFSYPAGALGRETVRFVFGDSGALAADTLGVALPIDHAWHAQLRGERSRLQAERRAVPRKPVDPDTERARHRMIERHKAMIQTRVLDRWMRPSHWSDLSCTLRITLMSTGEVLNVAVVEGSGDPEFDASMATAVRDASPLPLPADPLLFENFQRIEMSFDPHDAGEYLISSPS